jgi:group I intron endonuclease
MYIYKITNLINDKVYIGQSSYKWEDTLNYYGSGTLIEKAINTHGRESFKKELLEVCIDKASLDIAEKYWILHYKEKLQVKLYNITEGGTGGITYTKGSKVYEQIKHKLGKWENGNPGATTEAIAKRINTFTAKIVAGDLPTAGFSHGNSKGVLLERNAKYKGGKPSINAVSIEIDGIEYPSYKAASRVLNIAGETISRRCHSDKFKNYKIK